MLTLDSQQRLPATSSDVGIASFLARAIGTEDGSLLYTEGSFWGFDGRVWSKVNDYELDLLVQGLEGSPTQDGGVVRLAQGRVRAIRRAMQPLLGSGRESFFRDAPLGVACLTGFIQLAPEGTAQLVPHHRDQRQQHLVEASWAPGAFPTHAPLLRAFYNTSIAGSPDSPQKAAAIAEVLGSVVFGLGPAFMESKVVVLIGPPASGKSLTLTLIREMLPKSMVVSVPLHQLKDKNFRVRLRHARVNLVAETSTVRPVSEDTLKDLVTGDLTWGRDLYQSAIEFIPNAIHIVATNDAFHFDAGMTPAVLRRLLPISFTNTIPGAKRIPQLGKRIAHEERDALLALAVMGARRLIARRRYSEPPSSRQALRRWQLDQDPVRAFLEDEDYVRIVPEGQAQEKTADVYETFKAWCKASGLRNPPGKNRFVSRAVESGLGIGRTRDPSARYLTALRLTSRRTSEPAGEKTSAASGPHLRLV